MPTDVKPPRRNTIYWPTLAVIGWITVMGAILVGGALSAYLYQSSSPPSSLAPHPR